MLYNTTNPHGGDLYSRPVRIDFSANINPFGTPPAVVEALKEAANFLHCYPDPYCRELVGAISRFEGVKDAYILCGNGAAELIFSYCAAVKPKKALVLAPTFSEYETALNSIGCQAERFLLSQETGFSLGEDFIDFLSQWDGELVMLCNPNNPTGQVIPRSMMERIATVCGNRGIRLFIDECFLDLTEGGENLSMKDTLSRMTHVFLLKAFTKSYGMAGLRLGYCLSADTQLLTAMGSTVQPWNVSVPAQRAGIAALSQQEFLAKAYAVIRQQRPILAAALEKLGMTVVPSKTNYILFRSDLELMQPLLDRGIQIRSCANYPGLGDGWYRIAVKQEWENRELLAALEEIVYG